MAPAAESRKQRLSLEAVLGRSGNRISRQGALLGWRADGLAPSSVRTLDRFYRTEEAKALDVLLAREELGTSPTLEHCLLRPDAVVRLRNVARWAVRRPAIPDRLTLGHRLGQGENSAVHAVKETSELAVKLGSAAPRVEAVAMVMLESIGITTVYLGTHRHDGQPVLVLRRIDGPSSKSIIGSPDGWLVPARGADVVTRRTCQDLRWIARRLARHQTSVGDFQFLIRRSDGKVFMNDPNAVGFPGPPPGGYVSQVIERFERILDGQVGLETRSLASDDDSARRGRPLLSSSPARTR